MSTILYRIDTLSAGAGEKSFAFINPAHVSAVRPDKITVGHEWPGSEEVEGTYICVGGTEYFIPSTPEDVTKMLGISIFNPNSPFTE